MLERARGRRELVVGDNEPYPVDHRRTIPVHGEGRGLPHVLVEIRQDGIATPADAAAWAVRLAKPTPKSSRRRCALRDVTLMMRR